MEPLDPLTQALINSRNKKQADVDKDTYRLVIRLAEEVRKWLQNDSAHGHTIDVIYQGISEYWFGLTERDVHQAIEILVEKGEVKISTAQVKVSESPIWVRLNPLIVV